MTPTQVQSLISKTNCTSCKIDSGLIWYAIIAALFDVQTGNPVPADPQILINEASCASCMIMPGQVPYVILELIRGISGLVVSGGQQIYTGSGDPNGVTAALNGLPSVYLDQASQRIYWKTDGIVSNLNWY